MGDIMFMLYSRSMKNAFVSGQDALCPACVLLLGVQGGKKCVRRVIDRCSTTYRVFDRISRPQLTAQLGLFDALTVKTIS